METNQNLNAAKEATSLQAMAAPAEIIEPETIPYTQTEAYEDEIRAAIRERAKKDMLYGGLWCAGGTLLTVANIGYIFWGAIIFGGIQFFRGLSNYNKG